MDSFQVYRDMKARTNGEIYIGVVGPVRTGKSTFIKRFMDLLVLPNMTDEHARERTKDELPQSASGTTIMTTEPKFVPKEAASVKLSEDVEVKIRLIDCVGFMVEGASGHIENDVERQVKTPWFEYEIPFTKAAAIGTQKVIHDHATIGFVVTTDGSVTDLPREMTVEQIEMDTGKVRIQIRYEQSYYYEVLSELTGTQIKGEYELISTVKELSSMREELSSLKDAFSNVKMKGYGVVTPSKEDIRLDEPVIIKQGSKFGVKIRSEAPSIHMIRANIETEIAPIVGNEKQAQDLAEYIKKESETPEGVWGTNIFGKTVEELVMDGMRNKIAMIGDESQMKLQDSMQKIVNDTNGGLVCIII